MISRATWLCGDADQPVVARAFVSYAPWQDQYVCSVVALARIEHFYGDTAEAALRAGETATEERYGTIRQARAEATSSDVRLARWHGVAVLTAADAGVPLTEEEVLALSTCNAAQARGFAERRLRPRLQPEQQAIIDRWTDSGTWDRVVVDALFASTFADVDYLVEE